jgi:hypothetical protein
VAGVLTPASWFSLRRGQEIEYNSSAIIRFESGDDALVAAPAEAS